MEDLRKSRMIGDVSNKVDVNDVYRDLCAVYKEKVATMKTFTDSQKEINLNGLMKLAVHFNLKMTVDALFDKFEVIYNKEGKGAVNFGDDKSPAVEIAEPAKQEELKEDDDLF